jgi:branched-chain amino acid transport system ATP-binding protein
LNTQSTPLLEVKGLDKKFGGLHAVKAVDLTVQSGEIVGILGPNGAGKTTLFNLLTGFIPADSGTVHLKGKSLRGLKPHKVVNLGVARTFQLCRPFVGLSVLENVMVGGLGPRAKDGDLLEKSMRLLDQVGLSAKADSPSELLSYGDLRRLEIARALATEPEILLLDEPFAGLGSSEIEALSVLIRQLHREQKLTILLIEHKLREFMQLVSRVVAIDFGEVIATGVPDEIVANPRVIEAYIGKQNALGNEEEHA